MEPRAATPPESFLAQGGRESLFVRQRTDEPQEDFYDRVADHARRLVEERRLRHVAIGVPVDAGVSQERTRFCASVAGMLARGGAGDIVLFAADSAASETRHALIALAGDLCGRARAGRRSVTVRFTAGRKASDSGVFPAERAGPASSRVA